MRELHDFDFLKLVLADDAANIASVGAGFRPEAGRIRRKLNRQLALQRLIGVEVRQRNLRRRNQPIVGTFELEEIVGELGQLAGAHQRS